MSRNEIIVLLVLGALSAMTASADQIVTDQSDAEREHKRGSEPRTSARAFFRPRTAYFYWGMAPAIRRSVYLAA